MALAAGEKERTKSIEHMEPQDMGSDRHSFKGRSHLFICWLKKVVKAALLASEKKLELRTQKRVWRLNVSVGQLSSQSLVSLQS